MAETSYPFETSQVATELQWSRMARRWGIDGVHADSPGGTDLKVTANGTGNVTVAIGSAYVNGFCYRNDAPLNLPTTANAGGSARVDLVVLRSSQTANAVNAVYRTGGTVAPDLTLVEDGVWEIPIAQCTVAAGSSVVTAANVIDKRWFTPKGVAPSLPGARRPATAGQLIVEGNELLLGDGSNYNYVATAGSREPSSYTPVWTAGSTAINWGSGNPGPSQGRYQLLRPKLCWVAIQLAPTANPGAYTDPLAVTLPYPCTATYRSLFSWSFTSGNGEGGAQGIAMTFPTEGAGKIARIRYPTSTGNSVSDTPNALNLLTNQPFNIRPGDILTLTGTYEIA